MKDIEELDSDCSHFMFELVVMITIPLFAEVVILHWNSAIVLLTVAGNAILYDFVFQLTYCNKKELNQNYTAVLGKGLFEKVHLPKLVINLYWVIHLIAISTIVSLALMR